jgi:hypothetical protein
VGTGRARARKSIIIIIISIIIIIQQVQDKISNLAAYPHSKEERDKTFAPKTRNPPERHSKTSILQQESIGQNSIPSPTSTGRG